MKLKISLILSVLIVATPITDMRNVQLFQPIFAEQEKLQKNNFNYCSMYTLMWNKPLREPSKIHHNYLV